jgi:hypothetical protein
VKKKVLNGKGDTIKIINDKNDNLSNKLNEKDNQIKKILIKMKIFQSK